MCTISNNLRLCTCSDKTKAFTHYWTLHRYVKGKYHAVIGDIMMPYGIDVSTEQHNRALLLQLLNEDSIFDEPKKTKHKDRLQLSIKLGKKYTHYRFK